MSRIFNDGRLYDAEASTQTRVMIDHRHYPKMYIPSDESLDYLRGVVDALRFIMATDLQAVSLAAADAVDRAETMQEAIIERMEADENGF